MSNRDLIGAACTSNTDSALRSMTDLANEIVVVDANKEMYDSALALLDNHLTPQIEDLNDAINNVGEQYQNRVNVGCRTDLFWRWTSAVFTPTTALTLTCTKLSVGGYSTAGTTGMSTVFCYINPSTGAATSIASPTVGGMVQSTVGFITDHYHGIKYWNQPVTLDVGDTTVGSFIGTVGAASTVLTMMQPASDQLIGDFETGQRIITTKDGVFAGGTNTIVGFGTVQVDLTGIGPSGIGVTNVNTILLASSTVGFSSAPEADGSFTVFTVISDVVGVTTAADYALPLRKNPLSPETIGVMGSGIVGTGGTVIGNLGIGTYVRYDNTGISSATQTWRPEFNTAGIDLNDEEDEVLEPLVGAGTSHYVDGFDKYPVTTPGGNTAAGEGATVTVTSTAQFASLYSSLPACSSAVNNALTSAISTRDNKESTFAAGISTFNAKLSGANSLRYEKVNKYDIRIFGLRQAIGNESDEITRYAGISSFCGDYPTIIG